MKLNLRAARILDFDIETRPLSFLGGGFTTDEITCIACSFFGEKEVSVFQLRWDDMQDREHWEEAYGLMLSSFVRRYNQADIVTGHYIRAFDLPKINGGLAEVGLPLLEFKLTHDTKLDLKRMAGVSKSQENLGAMFAYFDKRKSLGRKEHMSQVEWREANRLTREGVEESHRRVAGDVRQHKAMRKHMIERGLLGAPQTWIA